MTRLEGRVAVVTGAGRGIGASIARLFAAEGAAVVVNDIGAALDGAQTNERPAEDVVSRIRAAGGHATANFDSVSSYEGAENMIRQAIDEYGRMDILVNVAGILRDRMIFNMIEEDWKAVLDVHLNGTFNTTHFASIYWRAAREGRYRLINFTSESGIFGAAGQPNYAAAKAGIIGLTLSSANALGRYGVTANCIAPRAETRMTASVPDTLRPEATRVDAAEGSPDRVFPPVLWLASKDSDGFNGRVIGVHGYEVSLFETPRIEYTMHANPSWDLGKTADAIGRTFRNAANLTGPPSPATTT
jgi:NAD(P)-dependent dehydrogenase (short-subunit alcohol dehydrogenase family)